ncbi:MAG: RNA ligase [Thermodesulfatator sp.]|nr:MAG: RNA ligase [Thermodesulfatator sp.]
MEAERFEALRRRFASLYARNPEVRKVPLEVWESALAEARVVPLLGTEANLFRLRRDVRGFPEGTILGEEILVPGFPHIPRIFRLSTGVPRYFSEAFFAEEKIEGYNVRLFRTGREILAVTRRGFICPFATDRWPDFLPRLSEFFEDHPELAVCCEVAGPGNPFVGEWPPYIKEDVRFFVFDLMRLPEGHLLPPEEKYALLEAYGFPAPEVSGPFWPGDLSPLLALLRRYEAEGREGVVLKGVSGRPYLKYVTPVSNLEDMRVVFPYLGEVPSQYLTHRLVRYILSHWELFGDVGSGEPVERVFRGLREFLERVAQGEPVAETFQVRFRTERAFRALLVHFRHAQVKVEVLKEKRRGEYLEVTFRKIYPRATAFWRQKLEGFSVVD